MGLPPPDAIVWEEIEVRVDMATEDTEIDMVTGIVDALVQAVDVMMTLVEVDMAEEGTMVQVEVTVAIVIEVTPVIAMVAREVIHVTGIVTEMVETGEVEIVLRLCETIVGPKYEV